VWSGTVGYNLNDPNESVEATSHCVNSPQITKGLHKAVHGIGHFMGTWFTKMSKHSKVVTDQYAKDHPESGIKPSDETA